MDLPAQEYIHVVLAFTKESNFVEVLDSDFSGFGQIHEYCHWVNFSAWHFRSFQRSTQLTE
jgi:hypothetical protein